MMRDNVLQLLRHGQSRISWCSNRTGFEHVSPRWSRARLISN